MPIFDFFGESNKKQIIIGIMVERRIIITQGMNINNMKNNLANHLNNFNIINHINNN